MGIKFPSLLAAALLFQSSASAMADAKAAAEQISTAPRWGGLNKNDYSSRGKEIATHLEEFVNLPQSEARQVIILLLQEKMSATKLGTLVDTLYLANRIYFNVPANLKAKDIKTFGGAYVGPDAGDRAAIWPLAFSTDGTYTINATYYAYSGPLYDVLSEFDYFSKKFERRYK